MKLNSIVKKIITANLIIAIILGGFIFFTSPQKTKAQFGEGIMVWLLDQLTISAGMAFKAVILDTIVTDIVKWINTGDLLQPGQMFAGQTWEDIEKKAGYSAFDVFVGQFAEGVAPYLCHPFGLQLSMALKYVPPFKTKITCTLTDIKINIDNLWQDFTSGQWISYQMMWTEPKQNFYGSLILSLEELKKTVTAAEKGSTAELTASGGFFGVRRCKVTEVEHTTEYIDAGLYDPANPDPRHAVKTRTTKECPDPPGYETVTPGKAAGDALETAMSAHKDLTIGGESIGAILGGYLGAIINSIMNRFTKEGIAALKDLSTDAGELARNRELTEQEQRLNPCASLSGDLKRECEDRQAVADVNFFSNWFKLKRKIEEFVSAQRLLMLRIDEAKNARLDADKWYTEITACLQNQIVDADGKITVETPGTDLAIAPDPASVSEQEIARIAQTMAGTIAPRLQSQLAMEGQYLIKTVSDFSTKFSDSSTWKNYAPGIDLDKPTTWKNRVVLTDAKIKELQSTFGAGPRDVKDDPETPEVNEEKPSLLDLHGYERLAGEEIDLSPYGAVTTATTSIELSYVESRITSFVNKQRAEEMAKDYEETRDAALAGDIPAAKTFYYEKGCPRTYYLEALQSNTEAQLICNLNSKPTMHLLRKEAEYETWLHILGSNFVTSTYQLEVDPITGRVFSIIEPIWGHKKIEGLGLNMFLHFPDSSDTTITVKDPDEETYRTLSVNEAGEIRFGEGKEMIWKTIPDPLFPSGWWEAFTGSALDWAFDKDYYAAAVDPAYNQSGGHTHTPPSSSDVGEANFGLSSLKAMVNAANQDKTSCQAP